MTRHHTFIARLESLRVGHELLEAADSRRLVVVSKLFVPLVLVVVVVLQEDGREVVGLFDEYPQLRRLFVAPGHPTPHLPHLTNISKQTKSAQKWLTDSSSVRSGSVRLYHLSAVLPPNCKSEKSNLQPPMNLLEPRCSSSQTSTWFYRISLELAARLPVPTSITLLKLNFPLILLSCKGDMVGKERNCSHLTFWYSCPGL
eukprot:755562-Hanusia_phi.AAC.5